MKTCSKCPATSDTVEFVKGQCKPCLQAWHRKHRKKKSQGWKLYEKHRHRAKNYGLTVEEMQIFETVRGYRCEICGDTPAELEGKLGTMCIDHCHDTGEVRGLLCPPCNKMLGNAQDDVDRLRAGIEYLERTDKRLAEPKVD